MSDITPIPIATPYDLPGMDKERTWRPLEYLNFYRLILSSIFASFVAGITSVLYTDIDISVLVQI